MIFDEALSRSYDDWFQTPSGRYIDAREKALILSLMSPRPGERLLDVGCGTGSTCGCSTRVRVTGLDASPFTDRAGAKESWAAGRSSTRGARKTSPFRTTFDRRADHRP